MGVGQPVFEVSTGTAMGAEKPLGELCKNEYFIL
jgi:hypothetical protein